MGIVRSVAGPLLGGLRQRGTECGHRFWELSDPQGRSLERTRFLKNAAILGGLLLYALD